jgi:hypothetical protein
MKRILKILMNPVKWFIERRRLKQRLAELRKRDPFIYK